MMFSGRVEDKNFEKIEKAFWEISEVHDFTPYKKIDPVLNRGESRRKKLPEKAMTFKEALFADSKEAEAEYSVGRILAEPMLHCPPCVPLLVMGEIIDEETVGRLKGKVRIVVESTKRK